MSLISDSCFWLSSCSHCTGISISSLSQASASLVSHVAARVSAVQARNAQLPVDLAGLTAACLSYMQGLSAVHEALATFAEVHMLKQQDQIDQVCVTENQWFPCTCSH